jgi:hypothetical protein
VWSAILERLLIFCLLLTATTLPAETFHNPRHIAIPGGTDLLGSADFNGDALPHFYPVDQVTDLYTDPHLNIELAQSGKTYTAPISVALPAQIPNCRAADLNKDGLADLICISGLPGIAPAIVNILLGKGNGTLQAPRMISFGRSSQYAVYTMAFLAVGDFNGDGNIDFIFIDGIGDQILTFLGDGTGNFPNYQSLTLPYNFASGTTLAQLAEVNREGHPDLLLGGPVVLLGVGDGSFCSRIRARKAARLSEPMPIWSVMGNSTQSVR